MAVEKQGQGKRREVDLPHKVVVLVLVWEAAAEGGVHPPGNIPKANNHSVVAGWALLVAGMRFAGCRLD